jgi:hypothetical protein
MTNDKKTMSVSEYVIHLMLEGRHAKAEAIAKKYIEYYKEDLSNDNREDDGTCWDCGYVFRDGDCQHGEIRNLILCDSCYRDRGGK